LPSAVNFAVSDGPTASTVHVTPLLLPLPVACTVA
jgi:hypothetical protein